MYHYNDLNDRAIALADYIIQTQDTIRQTAKTFSMAKSTVHYDLSKRLKYIDYARYTKVSKILQFNFEDKHIRGGEATKNKYKKQQKTSIFINKC